MSDAAVLLPKGTWAMDPAHSSVEFTIRHLGLTKVRGRFNDVTATLVVGDNLAYSSVTAEIRLASVDTNNADRDAHLASTDFFGVEKNPLLSFVSTTLRGSGTHYTMVGDLTINGITRSVELDVEFYGLVKDPDGQHKAGFSASTTLSRKDYGIAFNAPLEAGGVLLSDSVAVEIEMQFVPSGPVLNGAGTPGTNG